MDLGGIKPAVSTVMGVVVKVISVVELGALAFDGAEDLWRFGPRCRSPAGEKKGEPRHEGRL